MSNTYVISQPGRDDEVANYHQAMATALVKSTLPVETIRAGIQMLKEGESFDVGRCSIRLGSAEETTVSVPLAIARRIVRNEWRAAAIEELATLIGEPAVEGPRTQVQFGSQWPKVLPGTPVDQQPVEEIDEEDEYEEDEYEEDYEDDEDDIEQEIPQ